MTELLDLSSFRASKQEGMKESYKTTGAISLSIEKSHKKLVWPKNFYICGTEEWLITLRDEIQKHGEFYVDTETSSLNPWKGKIYCLSFEVAGKGYLVPLEHYLLPWVSKESVKKVLGGVFEDPKILKHGHNVLFDTLFIENDLGVLSQGITCDTMIQSQVLRPGNDTPHGLKELSTEYGFSENTGNYKDQFGKSAWSHIDSKVGAYYAIKDPVLTRQLKEKQDTLLNETIDYEELYSKALGIKVGAKNLKHIFEDIEIPLMNLTYNMTRRGVRVDQKYYEEEFHPTVYKEWHKAAEDISPYIEPYLKAVEAEDVYQVLESPTKLMTVMFDYLKMPLVKHVTLKFDPETRAFTKRTLGKEAIGNLCKDHPPIALLKEYRRWSQLKKLYVDALPDLITDGRVHPIWNTTRASTGRLSCSAPNLSQVASRDAKLVRRVYIPDPGNTFVSLDFSGQEMRWLAHYSRDPKLLDFFRNPTGLDIYSQTVVDSFPDSDFTSAKITREQFRNMEKAARKESQPYKTGKALVLGLGYLLSAPSFARKMGQPKDWGEEKFNGYHSTYPGVSKFHQQVFEFTRKHGYMTTCLGRRRYLPQINSPLEGFRKEAERASANLPIQGSSAEQLKTSALLVQHKIDTYKWPIWIVMLIHDEILFEVDIKFLSKHPEVFDEIRQTMQNAIPLAVPMETSMSIEEFWGHSIDESELDDLAELLSEED